MNPLEDNPCIICGPDNPIGLRVRYVPEGDGVVARVAVREDFQGFRGVVHGGVLTALLDDAMWHAVFHRTGRSTVTVDLTTRFVKPAPVGTELTVTATAEAMRHRLAHAAATIREAATGAVLAQAEGRFMAQPR
ncbi:MAG: PaaI family thioesterase [Actinomycetia bacterium]|nr:PaaI family thioesterase [Actinomycetes bacterium]